MVESFQDNTKVQNPFLRDTEQVLQNCIFKRKNLGNLKLDTYPKQLSIKYNNKSLLRIINIADTQPCHSEISEAVVTAM